MDQHAKGLATNPDDLSSIPKAHKQGRRKTEVRLGPGVQTCNLSYSEAEAENGKLKSLGHLARPCLRISINKKSSGDIFQW